MTHRSEIELGVSLYSYGGDFLVTMTLEDCLADIADMGATGVEILADTHIAGYPKPTSAWVDQWHALLEHYRLTPTCYSSWLDTRLHKNRTLTVEEALQILLRDLELAHLLGFTIVRPKIGVVSLDLLPDPVWRETMLRALPTAEQFGIRIAPEIHAPTPLRSKIVDDYLDLVRETGTEHFGLLIDAGIFQTAERGGTHSDSMFVFGDPAPALREQVAREMTTPLAVDPSDLAELMPYVFHVHAKFWDMTDESTDPYIPYDEVVKVFVDGGYRGSLSSEYEGPRDLYRASDMLRRQQTMLRRLVAAPAEVAAS
jgi:sugar phosphate isomerase/epimerase